MPFASPLRDASAWLLFGVDSCACWWSSLVGVEGEEAEGDRAARETGGCRAFSWCKSFKVQCKPFLLKTVCRTILWLCSLLSFALLFLLVAAWSYNPWLFWPFLSSLRKHGQASTFLYLEITAVVCNALAEKPVLIFHVSELHIPTEKYFILGLAAEAGFIFVLSVPFCGCAVYYLFYVSMLQHTVRGKPAADCPSPCYHRVSSADASGVTLP